MKVSEIFESVQGEGPNMGKRSVFLRTALCNLTCTWCDTKYTWDWANYDYDQEVKELSIDEITGEITKFKSKTVVITGGEPLLQQKELEKLLEQLGKEYFFEVETNGTIIPSEKMLDLVNQWNVSPKTANSRNKLEQCEISECYHIFTKLDNSYFKFVIENESDIIEIEKLIKKYNIKRTKVLLMPQADTKKALYEKTDLVREIANNHNVGFTSRKHIELWGNRRGS